MNIRKLKSADFDMVSTIIEKCLNNFNSKDYTKKTIQFMKDKYSRSNLDHIFQGRIALVAENEGMVIGVGSLKENELRCLFVEPRNHKKGVGRKIICELEKKAKEKGYSELKVPSSTTAKGFYEKIGYTFLGEELSEKYGKSIMMIKNL